MKKKGITLVMNGLTIMNKEILLEEAGVIYNDIVSNTYEYDTEKRHMIGLYACVAASNEHNEDGSISFYDLNGQKITVYPNGKAVSDFYGAVVEKDGMEMFKREQLGKNNGYVYIDVWVTPDDPKHKWTAGVHSLVAMTYMFEEYERLQNTKSWLAALCVNHKNNAGWDNSVDNLEWATKRQNRAHGNFIHALYSSVHGEKYCAKVYTTDKFGKGERIAHVILKGDYKVSIKAVDACLENIGKILGK